MTKPKNSTIPRLIQSYCADFNISIQDFADMLKAPYPTVYSWTCGRRSPSPKMTVKILDIAAKASVSTQQLKTLERMYELKELDDHVKNYPLARRINSVLAARVFSEITRIVYLRLQETALAFSMTLDGTSGEATFKGLIMNPYCITVKCSDRVYIGLSQLPNFPIDFVALNTSILKEIIKCIKQK